jgi:hypothetical protein
MMLKPALLSLALVAGFAAPLAAQADPSCTYDACAVRFDYSFFGGQHLVRGQAAERVASLSPFSSSIRAALATNDSASIYAATFQEKYRWGSAMAFAGGVIGTIPILLQGDDFSDVDIAFTITGYGIALVGGWLVTSGLDDLQRAIWWHNRDYTDAPE